MDVCGKALADPNIKLTRDRLRPRLSLALTLGVNPLPTPVRYVAAMRAMLFSPVIVAACAVLAGCGSREEPVTFFREDDPTLSGALGEPIMTDPDLAGMNRANSAASLPSQDGSLPTIDNGPEVIAAARSDALALVGGPGKMRQAPEPGEVAGSLPGGNADCADRVRHTMQWAACMPVAFPVYPRGAVQEAAGTDASGCSLRVVNFVTPVPRGEVMDFYFTRARAAGFTAERVLQQGDDVLAGARGAATYAVYARRLPSGNTEVELVTTGG